MPDNKLKPDNTPNLESWRIYFGGAIFWGILAFALLIINISLSGSVIAGFSFMRLIAVIGIIIAILASAWFFLMSWAKPVMVEKSIDRLTTRLRQSNVWCIALLLTGLIFMTGSFIITLTPEISEIYTKVLYARTLPLIIWITGLSAQTLIFLFLFRYKKDLPGQIEKHNFFLITLVIIALLFVAWGWVAQTSFQTESETAVLNRPNAPILETQVLIAWAAGMAILGVIILFNRNMGKSDWRTRIKPLFFDIGIVLLLWFATIFLWESIPIYPNWFVSIPREPNFEYYPSSDAFLYDATAQFLLVGEGFRFAGSPFLRRPLHALFLTVLHLLGGQNYESVVLIQIILLALLPALLYILTSMLHNRISGAIAAVLIMLREANSIAISGSVTTSHAKLLMPDLITTLAVVLFVIMVTAWFKQIRSTTLYPLLAGGVLGVPILIRFETIVFLIIVGIISAIILNLRKNLSLWFKNMLLLMIGIMLVISPWIWRNWRISGQIFIDSPTFRFDVIGQRYKPSAADEQTPLQDPQTTESSSPAAPENVRQEFISSVSAQAVDFIKKNPYRVAGFIVTHYLNSQIQTISMFPNTFRAFDSLTAFTGHRSTVRLWEECCSTQNYIRRMPYWHKWNGVFPSQSLVPLIFNSLILAVGIYIAWRRQQLIGLVPLILSTTYLFGNAVFRNSGGRYILPTDWVAILYFSIGLGYLSVRCIQLMAKREIPTTLEIHQGLSKPLTTTRSNNLLRSPKFYVAAVGLFLFGCTLPVTEMIFQPRYTEARKASMLNDLMQSQLFDEQQIFSLQEFMDKDGVAAAGRALYPRYYLENEGEPGNEGMFGPEPYPRISFLLAGPERRSVIMPLQDDPSYFPNAADVIIIGCPERKGDVLAIGVFNNNKNLGTILIRSPLPDELSCPLENPLSTSEGSPGDA